MSSRHDDLIDVEVAVVADETEAEIIRSRLEWEEIPARVAYRSQMGLPRAWSPAGLGFGPGNFAVRVPGSYAREARDVIGRAEPQRSRPRSPSKVVSLVAILVLIVLLLGTAVSLSQQLPELLR